MRKTLIMVLAACSLLVAPAARADVLPPPGVHLVGVPSYGGTGCPQGTLTPIVSDDGTSLTLIYDQYVAEIGPDVPKVNNRMSCSVNLDLSVPAGFQFSLGTVDHSGFMSLDAGVSATSRATYWLMGDRIRSSVAQAVFKGPVERSFLDRAEFGSPDVVSRCGGEANLNLQSELRLQTTKPQARGVVTTDTIDGRYAEKYNLRWSRCT